MELFAISRIPNRSWNAYHQNINQAMMTTAANAMVDKSRGVSLLDVG